MRHSSDHSGAIAGDVRLETTGSCHRDALRPGVPLPEVPHLSDLSTHRHLDTSSIDKSTQGGNARSAMHPPQETP
jgi:hypothetical protein